MTDHENCLIILKTAEALKLCAKLEVPARFTGGGLINKLEIIRELAAATRCHYAVCDGDIITAAGGKLTVTKTPGLDSLPAVYWSVLGVFWQQNTARRAEGLITGAWLLGQAAAKLAATQTAPSVTSVSVAITEVLAENDTF